MQKAHSDMTQHYPVYLTSSLPPYTGTLQDRTYLGNCGSEKCTEEDLTQSKGNKPTI